MIKALIKLLLRAYQLILSPALFLLTGSGCRFEPSCSSYMYQAVEIHGPTKGTWLGCKRLCRCHPWGGGSGYDPVPPPLPKCERVRE